MTTRPIDPERLEKLSAHVSNQTSGALGVLLAYIGDQLGLYRALAEKGAMTSQELADATATTERYVRVAIG